jgi:elongation factor 1-alpha
VGYDPEKVPIIPISGLEGENLVEKNFKMPWYEEKSFLQTIDDFEAKDYTNLR